MAFKYYAQDNLDQWLVEHLHLPEKGVIVDVGAGPDGMNMSNSKHLEEKGWTALCIEGDPRNKEILKHIPLAEMASSQHSHTQRRLFLRVS